MYQNIETYFDENSKIWSGPKRKLFYGDYMTVGEVALDSLSRNLDKVVQVDDVSGTELTARELLDSCKQFAQRFHSMGLKIGDVIGICANKSKYVTAIIIGAFLNGNPLNPLYPDFDKSTIQMMFKITEPKLIFCDVDNYKVICEAMMELHSTAKIYIVNGNMEGAHHVEELLNSQQNINEDEQSFACNKLCGDDTAAIMCSSGTTGTPKSVLCSHKALLAQHVFLNLTPNSVLFTFSPLYWVSGFWTLITAIKYNLKHIITSRTFTPQYFVDIIERHRITQSISGCHQMAQLIEIIEPQMRQRLSTLKEFLCAGSKVHKAIVENMNEFLKADGGNGGLFVAYGMTELNSMLSVNNPKNKQYDTEGKLTMNTEVRIMSESGEQLGVNERGILQVRSPHKWSGYYRNEEATKRALADGWLVSGDIGYFDSDGYLHICSRNSDIFKSNNFQISPEQIEDVILKVSGVLEACIFGIPDFVASNLIACAIIRSNNENGRNLQESHIIDWVAKNLSPIYHLRGGVYFVESFPRTHSGKLQRRLVWDMIQNYELK